MPARRSEHCGLLRACTSLSSFLLLSLATSTRKCSDRLSHSTETIELGTWCLRRRGYYLNGMIKLASGSSGGGMLDSWVGASYRSKNGYISLTDRTLGIGP